MCSWLTSKGLGDPPNSGNAQLCGEGLQEGSGLAGVQGGTEQMEGCAPVSGDMRPSVMWQKRLGLQRVCRTWVGVSLDPGHQGWGPRSPAIWAEQLGSVCWGHLENLPA